MRATTFSRIDISARRIITLIPKRKMILFLDELCFEHQKKRQISTKIKTIEHQMKKHVKPLNLAHVSFVIHVLTSTVDVIRKISYNNIRYYFISLFHECTHQSKMILKSHDHLFTL